MANCFDYMKLGFLINMSADTFVIYPNLLSLIKGDGLKTEQLNLPVVKLIIIQSVTCALHSNQDFVFHYLLMLHSASYLAVNHRQSMESKVHRWTANK